MLCEMFCEMFLEIDFEWPLTFLIFVLIHFYYRRNLGLGIDGCVAQSIYCFVGGVWPHD